MKAFLMIEETGLEIGVIVEDSGQKVARVIGGTYREGSVIIPVSKFKPVDPDKPYFLAYRRGPFFFTTFINRDAKISLQEIPFIQKIESLAS